MSLSRRFTSIIICIIGLMSCEKSVPDDVKQHNVQIFVDSVIRINQAIELIDTDWIVDSIHRIESRPGRLYRWKSTPDNRCAEFSGYHQTGLAIVKFSCAGEYSISADIYDEAGNELLASTKPVFIKVTSNVLTPTVAIDKQDTLFIRAGVTGTIGPLFVPGVVPDTTLWIQVLFRTSKSYEHATTTNFQIDSSSTSGQYKLAFSDSLKLTEFPFAHWTGSYGQIDGAFDIHDVHLNIPKPFFVTWLGKKYSGTVTMVNKSVARLHLEPAGAFRIGN